MIARLRGRLWALEEGHVVVDVGGVGYELHISGRTARHLPEPGQTVELRTKLVLREDDVSLYGFMDQEEAGLFSVLTAVSGVGPRLALAVLTHLSPDEVRRAVLAQDVGALTSVPGIGRKTASRLLVELQDRVATVSTVAYEMDGTRREAEEALLSLGLSPTEVAAALADAPAGHDASAMVRHALAQLGAKR